MEEVIVISTELANNLAGLIKITAERGTFRLEEFGSVAVVSEQLNEAIKNNKIQGDLAPTPAETPVAEDKE